MKAEPLVTRALEDAIRYCEGLEYAGGFAVEVTRWKHRRAEYRRLLEKLKPAKSVPKRGRR